MSPTPSNHDLIDSLDTFERRHIGPQGDDVRTMLERLGYDSLDSLIEAAIPGAIRFDGQLDLDPALSESDALENMAELAGRNRVFRSYIGMGYHGTIVPGVVQRNILENPGWYTAYTPYQAEISQGRLEALLNFQTMIIDLTGAEVANASLLDEATAAAEAMTLCRRVQKRKDESRVFFVAETCHPQNLAVVQTRAEPLGIEVVVGDPATFEFTPETFGALLQYPDTDGRVVDHAEFCKRAHESGAMVVVAADLLSLVRLRPPVEFGADVVVGSSQRFGMPMGFGGPHGAFLATRDEFKRMIPGRIIGVSKDADGNPALRMALQTREQHIRREKATSNICTAQVLPAVMASMYAVYHGPEGLRRIADRVHLMTRMLAVELTGLGYKLASEDFFDTIRVSGGPHLLEEIQSSAIKRDINLRYHEDAVGISLDETVSSEDIADLIDVFGGDGAAFDAAARAASIDLDVAAPHGRKGAILEHPVFARFHSETEMLRYMKRLENKDLSLTTSMIPLGSCTMKLNATAEMMPVTWPGFAGMHPFAPVDQAAGYTELIDRLERWCAEITGFAAVSMQPNAGSQGEYAGLLVIRAYHASRGDSARNICLIPHSAHGTNPASAILAGMKVVVVDCDDDGNVDVDDLRGKAEAHRDALAALMITYPSTHGVFEETIREICKIVHDNGGQVYLDGANMNAMVGLCRPGDIGADVCHLNLHKTFCIPHGGGGPGMGPIGVAPQLVDFLPGHPLVKTGGAQAIGAVSAAPYGSPAILPISYAYMAMMGADGLTQASRISILSANYIARRLDRHFPVLYKGRDGLIAHECIIDVRDLKSRCGIDVVDIAKRLMDYGYHAPTMSWPVVDTLMIEPTESESLEELDRFCDAMIAIRDEIRAVEDGSLDPVDNPLKNAPHTAMAVAGEWTHKYSRETAVFPTPWTRSAKFWPSVGRIDNVFGDRNLVCACPSIDAYESDDASAEEAAQNAPVAGA